MQKNKFKTAIIVLLLLAVATGAVGLCVKLIKPSKAPADKLPSGISSGDVTSGEQIRVYLDDFFVIDTTQEAEDVTFKGFVIGFSSDTERRILSQIEKVGHADVELVFKMSVAWKYTEADCDVEFLSDEQDNKKLILRFSEYEATKSAMAIVSLKDNEECFNYITFMFFGVDAPIQTV